MSESDYQINERLQKVEKQNRYMRMFGIAFVVVFAVFLIAGADKNKELDVYSISAQELIIKDKKGNPGIVMSNTSCPMLTMMDTKNSKRLQISASEQHSELSLFDSKSQLRFKVMAFGDAMTELLFNSSRGKRQVTLGTRVAYPTAKELRISGNGGYLTLSNKEGERVISLLVDGDGNGVVGAYDRKGVGKELKPGLWKYEN